MSSGPYRLARGGAAIERTRPLPFTFNGAALEGFAGDTLASALLANGMRVIGRSFKFHRPRGIFSAGIEEPNALVELNSGAHTLAAARATLTALRAGLSARAPQGWPDLRFDLLRAIDFVRPLFAAGFYNKTFMWPNWGTYEHAIRHMAGFGHAPTAADPAHYQLENTHCDVLVVGGGRAGVSAALERARSGARVLLIEQESMLGGRARFDGSDPHGAGLKEALGELKAMPQVRILLRTTVTSYHEHNVLAALEQLGDDATTGLRERYWVIRTGETVLATGAIEQPLIFDNNDRPGIMLAGAARRFLNDYGVAPGRAVVVATNNSSAYATALELASAGVKVKALLDSRESPPEELVRELKASGVEVLAGTLPVNSSGFGVLRAIRAGRLSADGSAVVATSRIATDALLVSGGWSPTLHLYAQAGGKLLYDERTGALEPAIAPRHFTLLGTAAGIQGELTHDIGLRLSPVGKSGRQWIDLRHDATVADIELAQRENFTSIEHVKRLTTIGMSVDQGKTSSATALQVVARLRGKAAAELGYTTLRPPFTPVTLGAIAGRDVGELFAPARVTPMHEWHVAHGGLLEDYGEWKRPAVYLRTGEGREAAIRREARAVRAALGLFDASTLGKIEIHGPDALKFLDPFYINNLLTLKPGKARYGIMLRESGVIFDDGTIAALAPDHLIITTTSGGALRVGAWLEEWRQCEWPHLNVSITPVTDQWATVALTGAQARTLLAKLRPDFDISNEALPHLAMREGHLLGHAARIYRVSFSGELTYEINVPASMGLELWQTVMHEGAAQGIVPYGLESLMLMRMEKGFLHIGSDTDGSTVPDDVGWGRPAAAKQSHYVGKRSLSLPENTRPDRLQLIGLRGIGGLPLPVGAHLRVSGENSSRPTSGWITSGGRSTLDDEPIALAMLSAGRAKVGREVEVHHLGRIAARAHVVMPPFFDPSGARMNA